MSQTQHKKSFRLIWLISVIFHANQLVSSLLAEKKEESSDGDREKNFQEAQLRGRERP